MEVLGFEDDVLHLVYVTIDPLTTRGEKVWFRSLRCQHLEGAGPSIVRSKIFLSKYTPDRETFSSTFSYHEKGDR